MSSVNTSGALELRPHQTEAHAAIHEAEANGENRWLLEMATGLGKTEPVALQAAEVLQRDVGARLLFLCHRTGILRQGHDTFKRVLGDDVEIGYLGDNNDAQVVFGLFQGMNARRGDEKVYTSFDPAHFQHVRVDEGHNGPANTYGEVIEYFKSATLGGMTATPFRHDGKDVLDLFGRTVYSKTLPQGIHEGLLAPVEYNMYTDGLRNIGELRRSAGNITLSQINRELFIPRRDEEVVKIVGEELESIDNPHGLIFCRTVEHAEHMAKLLGAALPYTVAPIHSKQPDNIHDMLTEALLDGSLQIATVVNQYDEGIDVPDINFICFYKNTASERVWLQELGRGMRLTSPYKVLRVVDLASNLKRIGMVSTLDRELRAVADEGEGLTPGQLLTRARFNFSKEAEEVTELADEVRARVHGRKAELEALRPINEARRARREAEKQEEEFYKPKFRPLHEALDYKFLRKTKERNGTVPTEIRDQIGTWVITYDRPDGGGVYMSKQEETRDITTFIKIEDTLHEDLDQTRYQLFAVYRDGTLKKISIPDANLREFHPFMSRNGWPPQLKDTIIPSEPTDEDIRKIEALLNLGYEDGIDSSSISAEEVQYQSEAASLLGALGQRASAEMSWTLRQNDENFRKVKIIIGDLHIELDQRMNSAVNYPDVSLKDRVLTILSIEKVADYRFVPGGKNKQYALLEDGTVCQVRVVNQEGEEVEHYGFEQYVALPIQGQLYPVLEPVPDEEIREYLTLIENELGPEIDWDSVGIDDVVDRAIKQFDIPEKVFGPGYKVSGYGRKTISENRGLVYKLILDQGIANMNQIAKHFGISSYRIQSDLKKLEYALDQSNGDFWSHGDVYQRSAQLRSSMPRKPI